MRTFIKVPVNIKEVRTSLKMSGVKTLMLRSNNNGILVCISDTEGNEDKFITFCKSNGFRRTPLTEGLSSVSSIKGYHLDYGRLYKYNEII